MKALTSKKVITTRKPTAKGATLKLVPKAKTTSEAQCCAKTSRTVAGCHD